MSWDLDKIPKYVINLDRRRDRWQHFQAQPGLADFPNIRRWSGVDGKLLNIKNDTRVSLFTRSNIAKGQRRSHAELNTKGGVGCYMSHVNVWEDFLNGSSEVALVFEDDIILTKDSAKILKTWLKGSPVMQNHEMWDFCILAPHQYLTLPHLDTKRSGPLYNGDPTCFRLERFTSMLAYLITKKGVRKAMPHIYPIQGHIDWVLSICSQLDIINLCAPGKPLFKYKTTVTDIHKDGECQICDVMSDFEKDSEIVPRWRLNTYKMEELIFVVGLIYVMYRMGKQK